MPFRRLGSDTPVEIRAATAILEAARTVDDPEAFPVLPEFLASDVEFGWDLEPSDYYLYTPAGSIDPVGVLEVGLPRRDNRHLVVLDVVVHPEHRESGAGGTEHRSAILTEGLRLAGAAGRTTAWLWAPEDDQETREFLAASGFSPASRDARRHQSLAAVDPDAVARLWTQASIAAADYELVRLVPPLDDDLLSELVEVTAAINDAPMGDLSYEHEVFDLARLVDHQTAGLRRGDRRYRILARHRTTGELAGHTELAVHGRQATLGRQADTTVARAHRGRRLGLLLKIDMMRWLAQVEPQLVTIKTYNNADNDFMIKVNEALGYRLSRVFATYQLDLSRT